MTVDRNASCPCGSGKKYRKCCLRAEERRSQWPAREAEEAAALREGAFGAVLRFAAQPELRAAWQGAEEAFGPAASRDMDEEAAADARMKLVFFHVFDHQLADGTTVAERFLLRAAAWQAGPRERGLLRRLCSARLRPYEVEEVRLDEGMRLRDLWSDQRVEVVERAATHGLTRWDVLAARVAPEDDGTLRLEGGLYAFPARRKAELVDALRRLEERLGRPGTATDEDRLFRHAAPLIHRLWLEPPRPTVVTAEGDLMELGKVVFDVLDEGGVRRALDGHPEIEPEGGRWVWREDKGDGTQRSLAWLGFEGERLVAEVTSRARAARVRRLLERSAGAALTYRSARYETVEEALKRRRPEPPRGEGSDVPPEVAAQMVAEYKQRHYGTWPDVPLPALDGRTPREAARDRRLRPRLVDLLKEMENLETRGAKPEMPAYDFGPMWAELGLERPS